MSKIIDFNKHKSQKEVQQQIHDDKIEAERKRKMKIVLSETEAYALLDAYLEMIAINIDMIHMANEDQGTYIEEEVEGHKEEIKRCLKLFKRLEGQYDNISFGNTITIKYNLDELYTAICSLESLVDGMIINIDDYDDLEDVEKAQMHLYKLFKDIEWERLKVVNPEYIKNVTAMRNQIEEDFNEKNATLTMTNLDNLCEYKYNQQFKSKVVLIEEATMCIDDTPAATYYYVQSHPNEFKSALKQLSGRRIAEYFNCYDIKELQELNENTVSFPKGWRVVIKGDNDISEIEKEFNYFNFEIVSFDDYEEEDSYIHERKWSILERRDELFYDLYDLDIISNIV